MGKKKHKRTLSEEQQQKLIPEVEEATRQAKAALSGELVGFGLSRLGSELAQATEALNTSLAVAEKAIASWPDAETDLDEQHVLALRRGRLVVDFYDCDGEYLQSIPLLHSSRRVRCKAAYAIERLRTREVADE